MAIIARVTGDVFQEYVGLHLDSKLTFSNNNDNNLSLDRAVSTPGPSCLKIGAELSRTGPSCRWAE